MIWKILETTRLSTHKEPNYFVLLKKYDPDACSTLQECRSVFKRQRTPYQEMVFVAYIYLLTYIYLTYFLLIPFFLIYFVIPSILYLYLLLALPIPLSSIVISIFIYFSHFHLYFLVFLSWLFLCTFFHS